MSTNHRPDHTLPLAASFSLSSFTCLLVLATLTPTRRHAMPCRAGQEEEASLAGPLPEPMLPTNWEPIGPRCHMGQLLQQVVAMEPPDSWRKEQGQQGKVLTADKPGSVLRIPINTTSPSMVEGDVVRGWRLLPGRTVDSQHVEALESMLRSLLRHTTA